MSALSPSVDVVRQPELDFERHRKRLWGIAYRMLGSRAEADDMVQEAYLRWHRAPVAQIEKPEAWLVTAVTRLAIDRLREVRAERLTYVGPWLPEPLVEAAPAADAAGDVVADLSVAFLALLERLAPEERAAFVLHEVFESSYAEIAEILGKSAAACRQIVSRAKKRVGAGRARLTVNPRAQAELLGAFSRALHAGDQQALLAVFAKDVTWTSDGGGKVFAARRVLEGDERIARFLTGVVRLLKGAFELRPISVNRTPGLAVLANGRIWSIWSFSTRGGRIRSVCSVVNPEKLAGVVVPPAS